MDYAAARGVPWGISESAYNVVDRHGTYQYKAFGVPGLGLKRGLGDELVVAPYATALAVDDRPGAQRGQPAPARGRAASKATTGSSTRSTTPLARPTSRRVDRGDDRRRRRRADVSGPPRGMTLVALANALLGDRMVERFHADPRVQATELLLQERVPRHAATIEPRPLDEMRVGRAGADDAGAPLSLAAHRRFRTRSSSRTATTSTSSPTPAAAAASGAAWR